MYFLALALFIVGSSTPRQNVSTISVSEKHVSVDVHNVTLEAAIKVVLSDAGLECKFDQLCRALAGTVRRTARLRDVTVDRALWYLIDSPSRSSAMFTVRREGSLVIIEQPRVTFAVKDAAPAVALREMFGSAWCDYCADLSGLQEGTLTLAVSGLPIGEAFARILKLSVKDTPYTMYCEGGCYIVRPVDTVERDGDIERRPVAAEIRAVSRMNALAAACACLRRDLAVQINGEVPGLVSVGTNVRNGGELVRAILKTTEPGLEYMDYGDVIGITSGPTVVPSVSVPRRRR